MKPLVVALHAVLGTALLVGCAAPGPAHPEVKPLLAVRDGGAKADDYVDLGRYYQAQDRYRDAADAYRRALALDAGNADAHSALGVVLALNHNFPEAIVALERAVVLSPRTARFHNNLGYAYYLAGDPGRAVKIFENAMALEPANARTWNNLGLALAQTGNQERSTAAFARAAALAAGQRPPAAEAPPAVTAPSVASAPLPAMVSPMLVPAGAAVTVVPPPLADDTPVLHAQPALVAALGAPLAPSAAIVLQRIEPVASSIVALSPALAGTTFERVEPVAGVELVPLPTAPDTSPWLALLPAGVVDSLQAVPHDVAWELADVPTAAPLTSPTPAPALIAAGMTMAGPVLVAEAASGTQLADTRPAAAGTVTNEPPLPAAATEDRASGGTLIEQVPTAATLVAIAPHAVALEWTSSSVVLRPVPVAPTPAGTAYRLEVANGNGVTGMARRIGGLLIAIGEPKPRLTNQKPFVQPTTVVQYREGFEQEAAALCARLPGHPVPSVAPHLRPGTDVRIVLGRDLPQHVALVDPATRAHPAAPVAQLR